jgi:hypothetical protein
MNTEDARDILELGTPASTSTRERRARRSATPREKKPGELVYGIQTLFILTVTVRWC